MKKEEVKQEIDERLWLTVKIKEQLFSIDSNYVQTIFQMNDKYTKMPNCNPNIKGIIKMRDDIITLIDLRSLLGIESLEEEEKRFDDMLEQRKNDHIHWVDELRRCLNEEEPFKLATDPHKCAFGKWYDNYHSDNQTVMFHLKKIDEPHRLLHETAQKTFDCPRDCEHCTRGECQRIHLDKCATEYMPKVLELLDEARKVFEESYRRMCVVVSYGGVLRGLLVDGVDAVQKLTVISDSSDIYKNNDVALVSHIAQSPTTGDQILMLDLDAILKEINSSAGRNNRK
ncbi:MAG: chemotaxis protein CheW [Oscillospiraceae bacterium]